MSPERVAVGDLDPTDLAAVPGEQRLQLPRAQIGVGAIGDDERLRGAEMVEEAVERVTHRALGAEGSVALAQLAGARLPHDLLTAPVRRQTLQEVVALDVTRVV